MVRNHVLAFVIGEVGEGDVFFFVTFLLILVLVLIFVIFAFFLACLLLLFLLVVGCIFLVVCLGFRLLGLGLSLEK